MKALIIIIVTIFTFYNIQAQTCPTDIKVGANCSCHSCTGTVVVENFETYIKKVLAAEWYSVWGTHSGGMNSLQAGAVAIRGYTISRMNNPVYISAHNSGAYNMCTTTCCQAYSSVQNSYANNAVVNTANYVLVDGSGTIMLTEYAAEQNKLKSQGNPTCSDGYFGSSCGIYDPVCTGKTSNGHGRGMCQWGSARWATGDVLSATGATLVGSHGYGKLTWTQILSHYYPNWTLSICESVSPPPNDNCPGTPITSNGASLQGTVAGATHSIGANQCLGCNCRSDDDNDVYYNFEAKATSHTVTISNLNNFDAVIELRKECASGTTNYISCYDEPGIHSTVSRTWDNLIVGKTYYVRVFAYNSSSNPPSSPVFTISVTHTASTSKPDLIVINEQLSSTAVTMGQQVTAICYNKNQGTGSASSSVTSLWFSRDQNYDNGDYYLGEISVPSLNVGVTSGQLSKQITIPTGPYVLGTWYIMFGADGGEDVIESNEANNQKFIQIELLGLSCTTPGIPASATGTQTGQTSASLSWSAGSPVGSSSVSYYWVVGTSSSVTYGNGIDQGISTGTSISTSALSPGTTYYLRVYAKTNCDGTISGYRTSASFTTAASTSCTTPGIPISATGTQTGQTSASLSWSAGSPVGSSSVSYYWVVGTSSSVTYGNGIDQGISTGTSISTSALSPGTTYYLRVYAKTSCDGTISGYRTSASFTTAASTSCTTPGVPLSATGTQTGQTTASLSWSAGNPVGSSSVIYYWVVGTSSSVIYGNGIDQGISTGTSISTSALSSGTTYYLRVYAKTNCDGTISGYRTSDSFTTASSTSCTAPSAPATCTTSIGDPANGLEHRTSLSCDIVPGADGYFFEYSYDGTTWNTDWGGNSGNSWVINISDSPNFPMYYRVRAYSCSPVMYSNYTYASPQPIYTACDEAAAPTVNGASSNSLNVTLNDETPVANPAITTYSIYCSTTSQYVQTNGTLGSGEAFQTKSSWGTKTVTGLSGNTQYCFYAKARNNDGDVRFNALNKSCGTTTSGICTTPGIPATVSGSATGQTTANLSWSSGSPTGSSLVTYYWVVGTSASVIYGSGIAQGTTTGISASATGLSSGTTYYLRVYAKTSCDGTSSGYRTSSAFTTSSPTCSAPLAPTIFSTSIGDPSNGLEHMTDLHCDLVPGAEGYSFEYSFDGISWVENWAQGSINDRWVNLHDSPNVPIYYRVRSYKCTPQLYSSYTYASPQPIYTACDEAAAPTVNGASSNSLNVTLNDETPVANPEITTYSIYCSTTNQYVQINGTLGSSQVFQTKSSWGIKTVTGLLNNKEYCFYAKARNNDGDVRFNPVNVACGTTVNGSPIANFSATPLSDCTPLTVHFADESNGNPTSWAWDIDNNGVTDYTVKNPTHTYSIAGTYSVKLTVTNASGSNSKTANNYITAKSTLAPGVSIAVSPSTTISSGQQVTFTATPTNGGSAPKYQWKVNGINVGDNNPTYTTASLTNGQIVSCVMTSNSPCANPLVATSNSITMVVGAAIAASVEISIITGSNPTCAGELLTFKAIPTNGGTAPSFAWKLGPNTVGVGNSFSTNMLNNGQVITCEMTSNDPSVIQKTITSNSITMIVNAFTSPGVSIEASTTGAICAGQSVSFTAIPINGGNSPSYQWKRNGLNVSTSPTYGNSTWVNGDVITCSMTSSLSCVSPLTAYSNTILMSINSIPIPTIKFSGSLLESTPANGYQWYCNNKIIPNATNQTLSPTQGGDYYVIVTNNNCPSLPSNSLFTNPVGNEVILVNELIKVYPNPTNGIITIEGLPETEKSTIAVYSDDGKLIMRKSTYSKQEEIDISTQVSGYYLLIINEQSIKIIKK